MADKDNKKNTATPAQKTEKENKPKKTVKKGVAVY